MRNLTILEAFEAMKCFLDTYYNYTKSDDVGGLLGGLQFLEDGSTADPAYWQEWEESVEKVFTPGYTPSKLELQKPI